MIAEFHLRLMLVGGMIIPMYEGLATIPMDFSPACLRIDPD